VTENVGLIKSIPTQYLGGVQGAVMRSITTGNGMQDQGQRALWVSLVDLALAPRVLSWYTRNQYWGNPWRTGASDGRRFSCRCG
jgi:hypothetical protein